MICTSLHFPQESRAALDLSDSFETESFRQNAFYKRIDFLQLAEFYGMNMARAARCLRRFADSETAAVGLLERSFLSEKAKADYQGRFRDRLRAIAD